MHGNQPPFSAISSLLQTSLSGSNRSAFSCLNASTSLPAKPSVASRLRRNHSTRSCRDPDCAASCLTRLRSFAALSCMRSLCSTKYAPASWARKEFAVEPINASTATNSTNNELFMYSGEGRSRCTVVPFFRARHS